MNSINAFLCKILTLYSYDFHRCWKTSLKRQFVKNKNKNGIQSYRKTTHGMTETKKKKNQDEKTNKLVMIF